MKVEFTDKESIEIKRIIERYTSISKKLLDYQKQADEIQDKVLELNNKLDDIKQEEDVMMKKLHKKYGDFTIQDIYNTLFL